MNDRELLELAAKATGIDLIWKDEPGWAPKLKNNRMQSWNPLDDDGDALRLAVKLQMHVYTFSFGMDTGECVDINTWSHRMRGLSRCLTQRVPDGDFLAATRRAIVRAAAEIGKAMP